MSGNEATNPCQTAQYTSFKVMDIEYIAGMSFASAASTSVCEDP